MPIRGGIYFKDISFSYPARAQVEVIKKFWDTFKQLCDENLGSEDYIKISSICKFIVIENIPFFSEENSNQQQRFITLIDILYEKKIPLLVSSKSQLNSITSSNNLRDVFKRTISRLHELTSTSYNLR